MKPFPVIFFCVKVKQTRGKRSRRLELRTTTLERGFGVGTTQKNSTSSSSSLVRLREEDLSGNATVIESVSGLILFAIEGLVRGGIYSLKPGSNPRPFTIRPGAFAFAFKFSGANKGKRFANHGFLARDHGLFLELGSAIMV